jgi:hypothetical protein
MAEIEVGDVVLAQGTTGRFHAVVSGVRLGRLVVDRCDGRASGPLAMRDVVCVFKPAGPPGGDGAPPAAARLRPSGQLRLELE